MNDPNSPTRPPPPPAGRARPTPGVPSRHLHLRSADDPFATRVAELEREAAQARAETAKARAQLASTRRSSIEPDPEPQSGAPFELGGRIKVRDWKGLLTFVLGLTGAISGIWSRIDKAPEPKVEAVKENVTQQRVRIEGPGGLADRVTSLERKLGPIAEGRCAEQQWMREVMLRLKPPIRITVLGCPEPPDPVLFTTVPTLPGKPAAVVVDTPMPAP